MRAAHVDQEFVDRALTGHPVRLGDDRQPWTYHGWILWCLVDELHIANVAVHSDWRGQGWGERLIQVAFYLGQQWKTPHFLLEVRRSNTIARQLYEKLGFLQLSVRRDYYRSPVEDALVLYHPRPPKPPSPPIRLQEDALRRPGL